MRDLHQLRPCNRAERLRHLYPGQQPGASERLRFQYAAVHGQRSCFPTKFLKFDEDEQTIITDNYTDIKKYVDEMHDKFISGVEDVNDDTTWNTYCKRIEDMHIDEVLKVYQASYDRWLAS